jgi:ABC-type branched-subunit amino acid transport system ATPase component
MDALGNIIAPLLVAVLATWANLTWRGVFVVLGAISFVAALTTVRLRDPGIGRWDTERIRETVREREHGTDLAEEDVELGFFEILRRLVLIPTVRRLLIGQAVIGVLTIPLATFLAFYFDERWNLGPGPRGVITALRAASAIVALFLFGRRVESMFQADPRRVLERAGTLLAASVLVIGASVTVPSLVGVVALLMIALSLGTLVLPMLSISVLSVVPARMRPHVGAMFGIAIAVGGIGGSLFLGGIDRRFGIAGSFVALVVPGVLGALILRSAGSLIMADLDRMIDETIEEEEIRQLEASGRRLPMLAARGVDFSYGQVQVLFDVDFTVDDGEMVALLGTNGAGKSTLLKVISGIGLPSAGSVRFRGADITYLDAERRLRLGITQIPGGRAVFGPMTVAENLRVFGHSIRKDRKAVEAAIERSFEAFPRLAERRNQKAGTLSGGEQQMLGLSKALLLRPRLLLIDELSLGLAPIIVGQLLDMVSEINRDGTAVVLVEQSVNIALGLVDHAYFMEKGQIRFDGPSADLLQRGDLLRAVFLEGVK